jgi:hypothetical protein
MNRTLHAIIFIVLFASCEKDSDCLKSERCNLVPEPGLCDALFTKYYFDKVDGKCKEFKWGGCEGVVPFETMAACKQCECSTD